MLRMMPRLQLMLSYQVCNHLVEDASVFMKTVQTFLFRLAHKPRDIFKLDILKKENCAQWKSYCEFKARSAVRYVCTITILQRRWYEEFLLRGRQ